MVKLREKHKKAKKHNNKEPICYNCGKSGHFKADCFKKKKDEKPKKKLLKRKGRPTRKKKGLWRQPGPMKMLPPTNHLEQKKLI